MRKIIFRYAILLAAFFLLARCANFKAHEAEIEDLTSDAAPTGTLEYSSFLVGDLGYDYGRGLTTLETMIDKMPRGEKESSLLLLGDIVGKEGLEKNPDDKDQAYLDALIQRLQRVPGEVYYTPGENELARDGQFSRLDRLEDYFDDNSEKDIRFMPNRACSGPDDEELFEGVGLIGINSAWYLSDWNRDEEVSEGCDYTNRDAMTFALADEIKGYRDQVKIVMMHHPLQANGNRGGQYSLRQHLFPLADAIPGAYVPLPVVGSIYRLIQGVGGGTQDIHSLRYQQLVRKIEAGIDDEVNVIFVSGHEHNMMVAHEDEYVKIVAGSGSERGPAVPGNDANYVQGAVGYGRLDFYDDGAVYVGFYTVDEDGTEQQTFYRRIIEDRNKPQDVGVEAIPAEVVNDDTVRSAIYAGDPDERGTAYNTTFGRHYRRLYYLPIKVPVLNVDTIFGGLDPYRRGGGMTTMSLHTEGGDGHLYQLRSVRKNPAQLLPSLLENSFAADVAKDQFTAIHPYAPLALPPLQKKLGLYAADPFLYYVPKQPGLDGFNTNFGGEMYWLEQRPDEDWSDTDFFGSSDDIISNSSMREELWDDWKNFADQENYARARLFDFFIGDWDRHRDQWRWAAFDEPDGRTRYVGIGRDRDQVFSNFDGTLLGIARLFIPEARKLRPFGYDLDHARWRALNGKWNDRVFLNKITREQMIAEAKFMQETISDEDIDDALQQMPPEVLPFSLEEMDIDGKLKSRLRQLDEFADDYYATLAESVNVLGTDKEDVFVAEGLDNGDLHVRVYDADSEGEIDELYYDRVFHPGETQSVILYGLGDDDRFDLEGTTSGITLRVIGGDGDDVINAKGRLRARAYDEKEGMSFTGNTGRIGKRLSDNHPDLNTYDFEEYYPSYTTPTPALGYNVDDGLFIGAGLSRTVMGWKPDPYAQRHSILGTYSTNEFYKFNYNGEINDLFRRRNDLTIEAHYFSPGYVANFFTLGNDGAGRPDEEDFSALGITDDQRLEYNRARREEIFINPMLRLRGSRNRFSFSVGPFFHSYQLKEAPDFSLINRSVYDENIIPDLVFDRQPFAGIAARITSNNLAIPLLADNGVKYEVFARQSWNLKDSGLSTTKYGGNLSFYRMITKAINFATRIGVEFNDGDPLFYQLASMGGRSNYRAARVDRYLGNNMVYQNIDLRFMGFGFGKGEVPTIGGFILGLDHGRVWLEGDNSSTWHVGYGGGVWIAPLGATILSLTYFLDGDQERLNFAAGFPF
ncbi:metallophosphoesterase [Lewinella sp. IMCC34183]|uniref:metallophosphoesterase n=1 Tax=Lewinella sp. IMCC34183 TaxID=2248762 RepID=UPI000E2273C4|nr:metallophosphoesterase [Lewinella sp. IMCC34183]